MTTSNTLVAYFSATGTTKKIAETLALVAQADLFEIVPKKLYTKEDLDWHNMDNYQNIFIGFPIWWYAAPRIIETFLESYNMENKFIIPFCTSGSSDIGDSAKLLEHCSKGKIVTGARLPADISKGKLVQWANMQKFYK